MSGTALAIAITPVVTPHVAAAPVGPVQHHNAITATTKDVSMGSITNNSGRTITNSSPIITAGLLQPGSHGNNDEYSLGLEFNTDIPLVGKTVVTASLTLFVNATYNASPNVIKIYVSAHDADTPAALNTTNGDLRTSIRPRTTATTVETITSVTASQPLQIDVTTAIQELLDRPGWTATRIIMLVDTHEDTTTSEWQDFDHFPVTPAELDIWTSD